MTSLYEPSIEMDGFNNQNNNREQPTFYGEAEDPKDVKENTGRWTHEEHELFIQGLKLYNKQWKQIAELIQTRTVVQIRTHAQKYFQKLSKMKPGSSASIDDCTVAERTFIASLNKSESDLPVAATDCTPRAKRKSNNANNFKKAHSCSFGEDINGDGFAYETKNRAPSLDDYGVFVDCHPDSSRTVTPFTDDDGSNADIEAPLHKRSASISSGSVHKLVPPLLIPTNSSSSNSNSNAGITGSGTNTNNAPLGTSTSARRRNSAGGSTRPRRHSTSLPGSPRGRSSNTNNMIHQNLSSATLMGKNNRLMKPSPLHSQPSKNYDGADISIEKAGSMAFGNMDFDMEVDMSMGMEEWFAVVEANDSLNKSQANSQGSQFGNGNFPVSNNSNNNANFQQPSHGNAQFPYFNQFGHSNNNFNNGMNNPNFPQGAPNGTAANGIPNANNNYSFAGPPQKSGNKMGQVPPVHPNGQNWFSQNGAQIVKPIQVPLPVLSQNSDIFQYSPHDPNAGNVGVLSRQHTSSDDMTALLDIMADSTPVNTASSNSATAASAAGLDLGWLDNPLERQSLTSGGIAESKFENSDVVANPTEIVKPVTPELCLTLPKSTTNSNSDSGNTSYDESMSGSSGDEDGRLAKNRSQETGLTPHVANCSMASKNVFLSVDGLSASSQLILNNFANQEALLSKSSNSQILLLNSQNAFNPSCLISQSLQNAAETSTQSLENTYYDKYESYNCQPPLTTSTLSPQPVAPWNESGLNDSIVSEDSMSIQVDSPRTVQMNLRPTNENKPLVNQVNCGPNGNNVHQNGQRHPQQLLHQQQLQQQQLLQQQHFQKQIHFQNSQQFPQQQMTFQQTQPQYQQPNFLDFHQQQFLHNLQMQQIQQQQQHQQQHFQVKRNDNRRSGDSMESERDCLNSALNRSNSGDSGSGSITDRSSKSNASSNNNNNNNNDGYRNATMNGNMSCPVNIPHNTNSNNNHNNNSNNINSNNTMTNMAPLDDDEAFAAVLMDALL